MRESRSHLNAGAAKGFFLGLFFSLLSNTLWAAPHLSPALQKQMAQSQGQGVPVIVIFKSNGPQARSRFLAAAPSPAAAIQSRNARPALAPRAGDGRAKDLWLVNGYALNASPQTIQDLAGDDRVEAVFENFTVRTPDVQTEPAPRSAGRPSAAGAPGVGGYAADRFAGDASINNWGLAAIGALQAWDTFQVKGAGVRLGTWTRGSTPRTPTFKGR